MPDRSRFKKRHSPGRRTLSGVRRVLHESPSGQTEVDIQPSCSNSNTSGNPSDADPAVTCLGWYDSPRSGADQVERQLFFIDVDRIVYFSVGRPCIDEVEILEVVLVGAIDPRRFVRQVTSIELVAVAVQEVCSTRVGSIRIVQIGPVARRVGV